MPVDPADYQFPDEWQQLKDDHGCKTAKMKVPGGWLYRTIANAFGANPSVVMVFVPDNQ